MANPPELWTFLLANAIAIGLGAVMTGLSFSVYYVGQRRSFRAATVGFGALTLGMSVEPFYQLGIKRGVAPSGRELFALQTVEGSLLGIGLALLFYSIYRHDSGRSREHTDVTRTLRESGDDSER